MKSRQRDAHAETVLKFLRSIGAFISKVRRERRIIIEWRWHGRHHVTSLPPSGQAPASAVARVIAGIRAELGLEVAA